jgi:hypothetical protein
MQLSRWRRDCLSYLFLSSKWDPIAVLVRNVIGFDGAFKSGGGAAQSDDSMIRL